MENKIKNKFKSITTKTSLVDGFDFNPKKSEFKVKPSKSFIMDLSKNVINK